MAETLQQSDALGLLTFSDSISIFTINVELFISFQKVAIKWAFAKQSSLRNKDNSFVGDRLKKSSIIYRFC